YTNTHMLKFLLPSIIGIIIFITPITVDGEITIPIAWLAETFDALLSPILGELIVTLTAISVIGTVVYRYFNPAWMRRSFFDSLFSVTPVWFAIRITGFVFA